jgi:probable HAF family extracellular repeat protein
MLDLGTLGGGVSAAVAINDAGQVVGDSLIASDSEYHAFLRSAASGLVDLGTLGGDSNANALNNRGEVVGIYYTSDGDMHAYSWSREHKMIDLGTLGGSFSRADALNDRGQIVGYSAVAGEQHHAVLWQVTEARDR